MSFQSHPDYTADSQASVSSQVDDSQDGASCWAIAEKTLWQLSLTSAATLSGSALATRSGSGRWLRVWVPGGAVAQTVSVAAGGTVVLPSSVLGTQVIDLSGAIPSDTVAEFPAADGAQWVARNTTTGAKLLACRVAGGSRLIYLAPGQSKMVTVDGTELRGPDERVFRGWIDVSLVALLAASPVQTAVMALPSNLLITRANTLVTSAVVGGTVAQSLGLSAGGAELLQNQSALAVDGLRGEDPSEWGGSLSLVGSALLTAAGMVYVNENITAANVTAGAIRVIVEGEIIRGTL